LKEDARVNRFLFLKVRMIYVLNSCQIFTKLRLEYKCAGASGAVHSVFLINVYLDLENPGGSGFWVGEKRRVTEGTERVSLQAPGSRGGRVLTQKEGSK
jgi:hypothetical protein